MSRQIKRAAMLLTTFALVFVLMGSTNRLAPALPAGTYTTNITAEELPSDMPDSMRKALAGAWELTFAEGNRFSVSLNAKPMVEGKYTATNDTLALTDEKGTISCAQSPAEATGKYKWAVTDAKKLTLTATDDKCEGRKLLLTIHAWMKKEQPAPSGSPERRD